MGHAIYLFSAGGWAWTAVVFFLAGRVLAVRGRRRVK